MAKYTTVSVGQELLEAIFEGARRLYPKETVMLLRGERRKETIVIKDLVVPPLANYGQGFADIPVHMLPMDFTIMGTVHSHPSGSLAPSYTDLNHFFGTVLMIVRYPYAGEGDTALYNRNGDRLTLKVTKF